MLDAFIAKQREKPLYLAKLRKKYQKILHVFIDKRHIIVAGYYRFLAILNRFKAYLSGEQIQTHAQNRALKPHLKKPQKRTLKPILKPEPETSLKFEVL